MTPIPEQIPPPILFTEIVRTIWPIVLAIVLAMAWLFRQLESKISKKECIELQKSCSIAQEDKLSDYKNEIKGLEHELGEMRKEFRSGLDGLTLLIVNSSKDK